MTLLEHLQELRDRLRKAVLGLVAGGIVGWVLFPWVFGFLKEPYCKLPESKALTGGSCELLQFTPLEAFNTRLHVSLIVGVLISSPVWLWQLWRFITPALYPNEKRNAVVFVSVSVVLFAVGASFAYLVLENALRLLLGVAGTGVTSALGISVYLNFVTLLLFAFGVAFEFPLLLYMLNVAGVLSSARMRRWRRPAIFLIFVFAAFVTPTPDAFTMMFLAVPLWALYEVVILLARLRERRLAAANPYAGLDPDSASALDTTPAALGPEPEPVDVPAPGPVG